jgi:nucleotide-binding universal stress UspA family protein
MPPPTSRAAAFPLAGSVSSVPMTLPPGHPMAAASAPPTASLAFGPAPPLPTMGLLPALSGTFYGLEHAGGAQPTAATLADVDERRSIMSARGVGVNLDATMQGSASHSGSKTSKKAKQAAMLAIGANPGSELVALANRNASGHADRLVDLTHGRSELDGGLYALSGSVAIVAGHKNKSDIGAMSPQPGNRFAGACRRAACPAASVCQPVSSLEPCVVPEPRTRLEARTSPAGTSRSHRPGV